MITLKIPEQMTLEIIGDLMREHQFAFERIGFIFTKLSLSHDGRRAIILATGYEPVADEDYIEDQNVGARINSRAIRNVMQRVLTTGEGAFHVHIHDHNGVPGLSYTDRTEIRPVMQSIRNAAPMNAHGLIVLSRNAAYAEALMPQQNVFRSASKIIAVGFRMSLLGGDFSPITDEDRFSRQTFLGPTSERDFVNYRVGIVGLGGGGSHIVQQLAHVGFLKYSIFDMDKVERSNLNRLIGATQKDVSNGTAKVEVASRLIRGLNENAEIEIVNSRWQDAPEFLRECDIVFGCVDSYAERRDLEIATMRYLIPYIDIGLDVHQSGGEPPRMAGQVILSMPGDLCMECLGFLTKSNLEREAERYGVAGTRPQVVWANGVLASNAVGIAIDLITSWTRSLGGAVYLSYDSNTCVVQPHKRLQYLKDLKCPHFPLSELGSPVFKHL